MRILITSGSGPSSRCFLVEGPDGATVREFHDELSQPAGPPTPPAAAATGGGDSLVDGQRPLLHGYVVPGPVLPSTAAPEGGVAYLVVASGPDAGGAHRLDPGQWVIVGRDPRCHLSIQDPSLSRRHARVRHERDGFTVEDLDSTNGISFEDGSHGPRWPPGASLWLGATRLVLVTEHHPPLTGRAVGGRLVATPWPRPRPAVPELRLPLPETPRRRLVPTPSAWSWALPLVIAGAVALVLRMPWLLMFGLLGPAMVLGQHLGDRRSARRDHEQALRAHHLGVEDAQQRSVAALASELHIRRARDPGLLGARATLLPWPSVSLWARADEGLTVVVGEGRVDAQVQLGTTPLSLDHAPLLLDLAEPVAVVGEASLRDGLVRSWLVQLATSHPPTRLALVVDPASASPSWDFLAWLPHTRPRVTTDIDHVLTWGKDLVLVDDVRRAPPGITRVLIGESDLGNLVATIRTPGQAARDVTPTLLSLPRARALSRRLAPLTDRRESAGTETQTLGDLVPWPGDEEQVHRGWEATSALRVRLGTDGAGVVEVDLGTDGPHALVAGTTGSGKSELLRTLVTSLALQNRPSRLSFLLIDYKGGSSLGECSTFPHATGLITDLDPHLARRVLTSLQSELTRREAVLADAGVRDVGDYTGEELPRLVVVIDEFRVLRDELPTFLDGLVRVAAVGRSLGIHLVMATQRPAGVITADLRANVNLRIALRLRDVSDSRDVIDCDDAARLPEGAPGHALLRTGASSPRPVLVAPAAPPTTPQTQPWAVEEVPDVWAGWSKLTMGGGQQVDGDLTILGALLGQAAQSSGDRARPVWRPPLPSVITASSVWGPQSTRPSPARPWAIADRPEHQDWQPVHWGVDGHLAIIGSARTGRSQALVSIVSSLDSVWLYVLDLGHALASLGLREHPAVRGWMEADDLAQGKAILEVLLTLVRSRLATPEPDRTPVLLVLDGWDRWVEAYAELDRGAGVDGVLRLLREGPAAHVFVLVSGDRSLLLGKVASHLPQTWALRLHDPNDLLLTGLPRDAVPVDPPPGRAVRLRDGRVAQVVLTDPRSTADPARPVPPAPPPPEVLALPRVLDPRLGWAVGGQGSTPLPHPVGSVLVLGPPGSGISHTLRLLAALGAADPRNTVMVSGPRSWEVGALARALDGPVDTVVLDDAQLLAGSSIEDLVLAWEERCGGRLLVGGDLEACSTQFRGVVPAVARHRRGVVLQPRTSAQGQLLGVHLPVGDLSIPGRGVLVEHGRCTRVQIAAPDPGPGTRTAPRKEQCA